MHVGHHRPHVPQRVGAAGGGVLARLHVRLAGGIPVEAVALVDGVDLALLGDDDVGVREHKLAEGGVEGEAGHAAAGGDHEVGHAAVHAVPAAHHVAPGLRGGSSGSRGSRHCRQELFHAEAPAPLAASRHGPMGPQAHPHHVLDAASGALVHLVDAKDRADCRQGSQLGSAL